MFGSKVLPAAALSAVLAACPSIFAAPVFSDEFGTNDNWVNNGTGAAVAFATTTFQPSINSGSGWTNGTVAPAAVTGLTAFQINNSAARHDLGQTITSDWTLSVRLLSTSYGRGQEVGLTDDLGNGYAFVLDTAAPNQGDGPGKGYLRIRKASAWTTAAQQNGTDLTNGGTATAFVNGNHWVTGYALVLPVTNPIVFDTSTPWSGYADFDFSWSASTGELSLWEDGALMMTRTDASYVPGAGGFAGFTRIVIGGNTSASYDMISLTVPEPTLIAPAVIGASVLLRRRKRV